MVQLFLGWGMAATAHHRSIDKLRYSITSLLTQQFQSLLIKPVTVRCHLHGASALYKFQVPLELLAQRKEFSNGLDAQCGAQQRA
ncbi:hypothetical protein VULLAG_LOCUS23238 [Vulpes lagopus]